MKIQFADKRINEFYEAGKLFVNDGQPFEVPSHHGGELLKAVHVFPNRVRIPVFELAESQASVEAAEQEAIAEVERQKIEAEAAAEAERIAALPQAESTEEKTEEEN